MENNNKQSKRNVNNFLNKVKNVEDKWKFDRFKKEKISKEFSETKTDEEGNSKENKTFKDTYVMKEPDYIKLYIKDIVLLSELPVSLTDFIVALLKNINYNGQIVLNSSIKKQLKETLKLSSIQVVDNKLTQLKKADIIRTVDRGVFAANPFFFGRGKWEDIREQRDNWIKISYKDNKKSIQTSFSENEEDYNE
ncbi:hypothetical protein Q5L94_02165 [Idiomarina sp. Sol25]|uniref:hypothetical protein n=1 Tax=Idiomarina sp. Sol25 TaxID=3064000 RepID=UPI00294AD5CB|nr:hypothetical protein [Idiomarina sp. Sol25]MDV6326844.1 hypothetical protein [Idiomarina sp. Sol25]